MTFGREAMVDGEDRLARRSEEVGYVGFAAGLAAAAVNDDGDGMNAGALRGEEPIS
ncbi:MAG: hypothetical protein ABSF28_23335 [Terracidiphilus sp.]